MNPKILDFDELAEGARQLRTAGEKLVATNGCFDLLHVGHVRYLHAARALGNALAVGLNGDQSVRELKGTGRPVNNESDRAEVLAALERVRAEEGTAAIIVEQKARTVLAITEQAIILDRGRLVHSGRSAELLARPQLLDAHLSARDQHHQKGL